MPPSPTLFRRAQRTFAVGACTLVIPTALAFSGLGFLRAHGAGASGRELPGAASLVNAAGAAEVGDGRSLCFEFATAADGPLWVLVQNRGGHRASRGVLVSRTAGFEDARALRAGSDAERHLLAALRGLALRPGEDARVQGNLERLCDLISSRQRPCPAPADWYLY